MKPFVNYLLIGVLLVGGLSNCAPTITTYHLEPVSGDVATIDGRQVTKAEQNGLGVVASFEREDLEFVALDVELKNNTDQPIDVNPAHFRFTALDSTRTPLTDLNAPNQLLTQTAADPTYEAGRIDYKRKQEEKRLKRAKVFNTILMVATIASDVSSSSHNRSYGEYINNRITHNFAYQGIAIKRAVDYGTFANRMQQYDYEEYRWRELALKANTLAPGQSIRGLVYLPKAATARYLDISYTVPEQATVSLLFSQNMVRQKKVRQRR